MSHASPAQQRGNTKTHKWQLKQSPLETHSALPCTHSEMWGDLIKNRTQYMAVLVQNGMVITLFAHPVAHSNRQPNLALNPCPQRWVLSFMSHVFLAQRQQQHNPTIGCNATCIQTSSRRERGSLSARRAVLVENGVVITLCGKSNNRLLKQPPLQTPYTPPFSIQDLLVPRTPCFSVHPANQADECRHRPVQQLKATRSR